MITNEFQKISPRFTLLEYFYVLLKSVEKRSEDVFDSFKELKRNYRLGRSKYKTIYTDPENLTPAQVNKYLSTFKGVIEESILYDLITEETKDSYKLTQAGKDLIGEFEKSVNTFNQKLLILIEGKLSIFKTIINSLYEKNSYRAGLLIFPIYSPRQLGFEKAEIKKTSDIIRYSQKLVTTLEQDIKKHLRYEKELEAKNDELLNNLVKAELLPKDVGQRFNPKLYDMIVKRFRDFWINYFLKDIYGYEYSWTTFERWVYRGKQIGIIHATEFYPNFNGKIIYPTSVIVKSTKSQDFRKLFGYSDGEKLYLHAPRWSNIEDKFVKCLVDSYFELRHPNSSYFISLPSLRELVCYKLRISEKFFEYFLGEVYRLNLLNQLQKIRISLEVDKHPNDTKAMYLTKEPVTIDGKYRNIIAIDVAKGGTR